MHALLILLHLTAVSFAGPREATTTQRGALAAHPFSSGAEVASPALDGSLQSFRAAALTTHPELHRAHAAWAAAVYRTTSAGSLPDPTLTFAAFVQSVETRVGPQQARVSLQQALPWPATLRGRSETAVAEADAASAALGSAVLSMLARVDTAYWNLWELRARRDALVDHLSVLDGVASTVGARVETGAASVATLHQVDLARARLADRIESMDALESVAHAELAALVGAVPSGVLPTSELPPPPRTPELGIDVVAVHPRMEAARAAEAAAQSRLQVARTHRRPGLMVGADWMVTGPSAMDDVDDSGKDAFAVGVGLRLPLSWRAIGDDIRAAEAAVGGATFHTETQRRDLEVELLAALAQAQDTARRVQLTEGTLLPQAEAVYAGLLGAFAVGRAPLADLLLAQRDLLDIRIETDALYAGHARAWAALNALSSRPTTVLAD